MNTIYAKIRETLRTLLFFFPLQLVMVHVKKNQVLVLLWLIIVGITFNQVGSKYGISNLFLAPEYMNHVTFWSYFLFGFAFGGFVMAYNISSYIMNGEKFPFIATLSKPFWKYSMNNSTFPVIYLILYHYCAFTYLKANEFLSTIEILKVLSGFLVGYTAFVAGSLTYFFTANKDLIKLFGEKGHEQAYESRKEPTIMLHKKSRWSRVFMNLDNWETETYLTHPFKAARARDVSHYNKEMIMGVLTQNHTTASYFMVLTVVTLFGLGLLRDIPELIIPAGSSILILLTIFIMIESTLKSWLRSWSQTVFIVLFIILNYLSQFPAFNYTNKAYGLNYNTKPAPYNLESLKTYNAAFYEEDKKKTIEILNKWRIKNTKYAMMTARKPKFVIINTNGGGSRSALWTFHVIQHADSLLGGEFLKHTALISGSSGGLIGAAYMRELMLKAYNKEIPNVYNSKYTENIGKDILNPLSFSIAVNDFFIRWQTFEDRENTFTKDRAYAFEQILNLNLENVFDKRLRDYEEVEKNAIIPLMIMAPTITNDGRQLLISSQPMSYLTDTKPENNVKSDPIVGAIEFRRLFEKQDGDMLRFTSALRMSATFPYVLPNVSLPSEPVISAMDAGLRDNYGFKSTLKFLYTFRDWISSNTSGVVLVHIRDAHKNQLIDDNSVTSITETFTSPVGTVYNNLFSIQDYDHDFMKKQTSLWFDGQIDIINLELDNKREDPISLSWHLSPKEKRKIINSIYLKDNSEDIERLRKLLE